jgi:ferredoxin-NADP reductase
MTALQLLGIISSALLLQVLVGLGVIIVRRRAAMAEAPSSAAAEPVSSAAGAWPGWRDFRVARRAFEDAAHSQCSFYLQPVDSAPLPAFKPGQYLTVLLPFDSGAVASSAAARSITRCYSLSDPPDPAAYRITIKRVPPPAGRPELPAGLSSNHFHDRVQEGDVVKVRAPSGRFFIDADASVPVVLVAGGIGITPLISMLRWCTASQPGRLVHLYYGVRSGADHAFKQVLQDLAGAHPAVTLHVVYSCPGPDDVQGRDYQHAGRIDIELLRRQLPHGPHQFYVCGPPAMMQSLVPALREWGVPERDLHFEAFGPASVRPASDASNEPAATTMASIDVRFQRTGRTLPWTGQDANLLDFAERHGIAVDSGCRSGSCGTCETQLVSGLVRYAEKPDYEVASGHCLLCVATPQADLVLQA